jgi:hypothetical protein
VRAGDPRGWVRAADVVVVRLVKVFHSFAGD